MKEQRKYRSAPRQELNQLTLDSFSSCETLQKLAGFGKITEASSTGILIKFQRDDFVAKELRTTLNIDHLIGTEVYFHIHEMNLEISGRIARTKFLGKDGGFIVAVDYTADAPEYWRECLMDLLPTG